MVMEVFVFLILFPLLSHHLNSEPTQDKQALLAFLSQTPHSNRVRWNASDSACNWVGVECDSNQSYVYRLRLPGVSLVGRIPPNTIGRLSQLRVLSFRSNRLSGEIPSDFSNLTFLRNLYLQDNNLSGEFLRSLTRLTRLTRVDLSSNNFSGQIPLSVNNLTRLTGLFLENNSFSGTLPSISTSSLSSFNVSYNNLNGSIPESLSNVFPESSFAGNLNLCGKPLPPCKPFFPSPAPSPSDQNKVQKSSRKLSTAAIIGIVIGSIFIFFILLLLLFLCLRKRTRRHPTKTTKPATTARLAPEESGTLSSKDDTTVGSSETVAARNKLVFFEGGVYSFRLEDLLRASAEVLGKGSLGTSYKAVLEEGATVVVKRLKDVVVSKKEYEVQMEVVGKIKHENVVPLRAFYYSNDEKLLVFDFMAAGSLSASLHGGRGSGRTPLDWEARKKIALTAARGLSFLHSSKITHGNIKSSNVLLRPDHQSSLPDFGLNPLFGSTTPPNRIAGYGAPEVHELRKVTFKSDVYGFGVLLLELLTGIAPNQTALDQDGIDLPSWVQSVVREEWTAEVFDVELMRFNNDVEEEMVQLLQIAMTCVSTVPDRRPEMDQVVRMIEEIHRSETDDGLRQSSDDPSKDPTAIRCPRKVGPLLERVHLSDNLQIMT